MLVTHIKPGTKVVRSAVCGVRLGTMRVERLMHGRELVWPTLSDTVAKAILDVPALDGTLEGAYWAYALGSLDAGGQVFVRVGRREYVLDGEYKQYDRAHYDGAGGLEFGDNGPFMEDLQAGDEVEVHLVVPSRKSEVYRSDSICLPYLEGTDLIVTWHKGQKKVQAGRRFTVTGVPSGMVHFGGHCYTDEHKRHDQTRVLPGNTHKWAEAVYDGSFVPGDTSMDIDTEPTGSGGGGGLQFLFPDVEARFKVKVTGVIRHG